MRVCRHQTVLCALSAAACVFSSAWLGAADPAQVAQPEVKKTVKATGQGTRVGLSSDSGLVLGPVEVRRLLTHAWDALDQGEVPMAHAMAEAALERSISSKQFGQQPIRVLLYIESRRLRGEPSTRPAAMTPARMAEIDSSLAKPTGVKTTTSTQAASASKSAVPAPADTAKQTRPARVSQAAKAPKPESQVAVRRLPSTDDSGSAPTLKKPSRPAARGRRLPRPERLSSTPARIKSLPPAAVATQVRSTEKPPAPRARQKPAKPADPGTWLPSSVKISSSSVLNAPPQPVVTRKLPVSRDPESAPTVSQPSKSVVVGHAVAAAGPEPASVLKKTPEPLVAVRQLPSPSDPAPELTPQQSPQPPVEAQQLPSSVKFNSNPDRELPSPPAIAGIWEPTSTDSEAKGTDQNPTQAARAPHVASPIGVFEAVSESPVRVAKSWKPPSFLAPGSETPAKLTKVAKTLVPVPSLASVVPPVAPVVKSEAPKAPAVASVEDDAAWTQFRIVLPSGNTSPHFDRLPKSEVAVKSAPAASTNLASVERPKLEPAAFPVLPPAERPILKPAAFPILPVIQVSFDEESEQQADEATAEASSESPAIAIQSEKSAPKLEMHFSPLSSIDVMAAVRIPTKTVEDSTDELKTPGNRARDYNNSPEVRNLEAMEWYDFRPSRNTYAFHHYPLYFEDPNLERCGKSLGLLTNFSSAALTLGQLEE